MRPNSTAEIVCVTEDGTATTTSLIVASGTDVEHRAVLQLIRNNVADFEEFGGVAFQMQPFDTAGGPQRREIAILTEEHATLLLTYMRNSDVVRQFKKNLVRAFWSMKRDSAPAPTGERLLALAVVEAQQMLAAKDERIAELEPKADLADDYLLAQGGARLVREVAKTLGWREKDLRRWLVDEKLIFVKHSPCGATQYDFYAQYTHHFQVRETVVAHQWGTCTHYTLQILPRGVELIHRRMNGDAA